MPIRLVCALALFLLARPLYPQGRDSALSEGEVEQLREVADVPSDRVLLFVKLIDTRIKNIQDLYAKSRRPGREQDTHDLLEQITLIADELDDNLDDYGPRHSDIRKALPKLIEATDRWTAAIKAPPENATYDVSRRLTLESIQDIREAAQKLVEEQKDWFLAHPPANENSKKKKNADQ
jgi:hypothetical protein